MHAARQRQPERRPARTQRDEALVPQIQCAWRANLQVYGADKIWRQLGREGIVAARCTIERLMRKQGLRGVMRGKVVRDVLISQCVPADRIRAVCFGGQRPLVNCTGGNVESAALIRCLQPNRRV